MTSKPAWERWAAANRPDGPSCVSRSALLPNSVILSLADCSLVGTARGFWAGVSLLSRVALDVLFCCTKPFLHGLFLFMV